jgi:hypothetical protein
MRKYNRGRRDYARRYRQSKALWAYQTVRLDHDDAKALRALAKRKGVAVAELIRTFIVWGLENDYAGADTD